MNAFYLQWRDIATEFLVNRPSSNVTCLHMVLVLTWCDGRFGQLEFTCSLALSRRTEIYVCVPSRQLFISG
jgi:hypothetical protein